MEIKIFLKQGREVSCCREGLQDYLRIVKIKRRDNLSFFSYLPNGIVIVNVATSPNQKCLAKLKISSK
jgi:hypothetical protein